MTKSQNKRKTEKTSQASADDHKNPPEASQASRLTTNEHAASDTGSALSFSSSPTKPHEEASTSTQCHASKEKKAKRRKRKHSSSAEIASQKPVERAVFHGLTLAISALESTKSTNKESAEDGSNYKTLANILKTHGATISPQVHKRVHCLVSTRHAVNHLTQRVRQALKRHVDIVDASWVKECVEGGARVDTEVYLLNRLAGDVMSVKENEKEHSEATGTKDSERTDRNCNKDGYESDIPEESDVGWSSPVQLDCCCVCHENGDDNCPWCTECNVTLAKSIK